jgi:tripartite-type tricarboxylate transporter receptor subunit TctC
VIVATGSLLGAVCGAAADDAANRPNRAVRLLAASAAGGNPDVMARLLGDKLSKAFNNPSIVEDVPGVGGVIDANETVQAPPDGYTLSLNDVAALAINVAMNPDVKYTLQDSVRGLFVNAASPSFLRCSSQRRITKAKASTSLIWRRRRKANTG